MSRPDRPRDERRRAPRDAAATRLRILIVDDEPLACLRLRTLMADLPEPATEVIGDAGNVPQALALLQRTPADLVLLDIGLPGESGLQLAAQLARAPGAPTVVFVTAHAEHALTAFELDAADYLTKPVRRDRLQAALQRVVQRRAAASPTEAGPALVATDRGRIVQVPVAEVLYLKAELKYVTMHTPEHTYVLDESLVELEQRLGPAFIRIHRQALVARAAVRELRRQAAPDLPADQAETAGHWAVRLSPTDEWLPVSRRQLALVRQSLAAGLPAPPGGGPGPG